MEHSLKYEIIEATPAHRAALNRLYRENAFGGAIDLRFLRGEDPYTSLMTEGKDNLILLSRNTQNGEIIAMGACCIHDMYVDGQRKRVGYLGGLKCLPAYRKKTMSLFRGFSAMGDMLRERADLFIALILSSEQETQRIFERRRKHFPAYVRQCGYTVFCFAPAKSPGKLLLQQGDTTGLEAFYAAYGPQYNLMPCGFIRNTAPERAIVWREDGVIKAACVIHDDRQNKNYVLEGYHGIAKVLPLLPTRLFGYPKVPKPGQNLNLGTLSMLLFAPDVSVEDRRRFIRAASAFGTGFDMLMAGITDHDPTFEAFKGIRCIPLNRILYTVNWEDDVMLHSRPIFLDPALI